MDNEKLYIFYRFSDGFQGEPDSRISHKPRPNYFNKRNILLNFIKVFTNNNLFIIADNVSDESMDFLKTIVKSSDYLIRTNFRSGAFSFLHSISILFDLEKQNLANDDTSVYFVEDDYIHRENSPTVLLEGLSVSDYVTLYDHPDKYKGPTIGEGGNPLLVNIKDQVYGEQTKVLITKSCHWKITNSTTMTFAAKLRTIKQDYQLYQYHCQTGAPQDFSMFLDLGRIGRVLISPMPSYSTHCETGVLSYLFDWNDIMKNI